VRIAVISDTHMPRGGRVLPPACVERLRAADLSHREDRGVPGISAGPAWFLLAWRTFLVLMAIFGLIVIVANR